MIYSVKTKRGRRNKSYIKEKKNSAGRVERLPFREGSMERGGGEGGTMRNLTNGET